METPFEQNTLEKQEEASVKPLHPKRQAFVREYCKDKNATKAAIRSGYSVHSAEAAGCALLSVPEIRAEVDKELAAMAVRAGMSREFILQEMGILAAASLSDFRIDEYGNVQPAEGCDRSVMRALQSIKKNVTVAKDGSKTYSAEIRLWGKAEPLKLMGREVGVFRERTELTGKDGGPIETITKIERVIIRPKEPA